MTEPYVLQNQRVLTWLSERAEATLGLKRLVLFGSRARGDADIRSDFDLAVESEGWTRADFAKFSLTCKEELPSLAGSDIIWLNEAGEELSRRIHAEGKEIYSRAESKSRKPT